MRTILFIAGALVLLGGFGYLAYVAVEKKRESEFTVSRQMPRAEIPKQKQFQGQPFAPRPAQPAQRAASSSNLRAIEEQKALERKRMFAPFGTEKIQEKLKPEAKNEKSGQKSPKEKPTGYIKTKKRTQHKKPKEDVFLKLKEMALEQKKKPGKKNVSK